LNYTVTSNHLHLLVYKEELGFKAIGRKIYEGLQSGMNTLREPACAYNAGVDMKNGYLSCENELFWDIYSEKKIISQVRLRFLFSFYLPEHLFSFPDQSLRFLVAFP
jgi:hypothetical protein